MSLNWAEVNKKLSPLKDYADLCGRFRVSFSFEFVRQAFNFPLPDLADYTRRLLGGDTRQRYGEYVAYLEATIADLDKAGVPDIRDLVARTAAPELLETLADQSQVDGEPIVGLLKYLVYWVVPGEKYLSGLVRDDPASAAAIKTLREGGVRTNLELLERGRTPAGRQALAQSSGLADEVILDLVNRADFSRLPWASKATISNIIGAGYPSLAALAEAEAEAVYFNFFAYGQVIGKNLKLGNEIENSYRIARIVPRVVEDPS